MHASTYNDSCLIGTSKSNVMEFVKHKNAIRRRSGWMDGLKTKATLKQETSQLQSVSVFFFLSWPS